MASIFVQIPSYHDYELPRTILDAIKMSSGEHQINFGVHLTFYEKNDINIPSLENIKISIEKSPNTLGVGIGRYLANKHYSGEDYYFQIDSHIRFAPNWDNTLINCYKYYVSDGCTPVLSTYPAGYEYTENNTILKSIVNLQEEGSVSAIGFVKNQSFMNNTYNLHQIALKNTKNNTFVKSISASFIFSSGSIASIEPNKNIFFWGEEMLTAIRLFTSGYDLLIPDQQVIFHLYYDTNNPVKNLRRMVFSDYPTLSSELEKKSNMEISRIIETQEIGSQALGSQRSLRQYEIYAGVDFQSKTITDSVQ